MRNKVISIIYDSHDDNLYYDVDNYFNAYVFLCYYDQILKTSFPIDKLEQHER